MHVVMKNFAGQETAFKLLDQILIAYHKTTSDQYTTKKKTARAVYLARAV
jgi:hypothetical protein